MLQELQELSRYLIQVLHVQVNMRCVWPNSRFHIFSVLACCSVFWHGYFDSAAKPTGVCPVASYLSMNSIWRPLGLTTLTVDWTRKQNFWRQVGQQDFFWGWLQWRNDALLSLSRTKNIQVSKLLQSVNYQRLQMALKTPNRLLRNPEISLKIITKSSLGKFSLRTQ